MATIQKRQPAYFSEVHELLNSPFTKTEGWDPNFIITSFGLKVSRTTLIGTVVEDNENSIVIDDSTGLITVRTFDDVNPFEGIKNGDIVQIIGKIRQYNDVIYLTPETLKKVDEKWISYKKKNIELVKKLYKEGKIEQEELQHVDFSTAKEAVQEVVETAVQETTVPQNNLLESIMTFIDTEDKGEGVEKVRILEKFDDKDTPEVLENLIMEGDIFEVKPGVFKVLK